MDSGEEQIYSALRRDRGGIAVVYYATPETRRWNEAEVIGLSPEGADPVRVTDFEAALANPDRLVLLIPTDEVATVLDMDGGRDRILGRQRRSIGCSHGPLPTGSLRRGRRDRLGPQLRRPEQPHRKYTPGGPTMLLTLSLLTAAALAGDSSVRQALPTGMTPTTLFANTSLVTVGQVTAAKVTYAIHCGTLARVKTCAAYDGTGHEVARTTNIQSSDTEGVTMTFGDGDGFVYHTITWTLK